MDSTVVAAIIASLAALIGIIISHYQFRRELASKIDELRNDVTAELIRQRIGPYGDFLKELETASTVHRQELEEDSNRATRFQNALQDALYGKVGLLASHSTRTFLLLARDQCSRYINQAITYEELKYHLWAVHFALRSDLGISQPEWDSVVDQQRTTGGERLNAEFHRRIVDAYWDRIDRQKMIP